MQSSVEAIEARRRASGLSARLRSFAFAANGLRLLVRQEPNARLHLAVTIAVIAAGASLHIGRDDWRWIAVALALVWAAEAFNSAVERLCDRINPAQDKAIGEVKDLAAGAVLACACAAACIGLATFLPHLLEAGAAR